MIANKTIRVDLQVIADMIEPKSRLLDVGCGDGQLLEYLTQEKDVDARGIEISTEGVHACVSNGLSVVQGDADTDLADYPDNAFDFVVLSQTLQAMQQPKVTLDHLLRIGKYAIVSFPNFGHWRVRLYLLFKGRMPLGEAMPYQWYETPNIHFCTIRDFVQLCKDMDIKVLRSQALDQEGNTHRIGSSVGLANLFGQQAVFLLSRHQPNDD